MGTSNLTQTRSKPSLPLPLGRTRQGPKTLKSFLRPGNSKDLAFSPDWLREWNNTRQAYLRGNSVYRKKMESRAILFASLTIHNRWGITYNAWVKGKSPWLPAAKRFLLTRRGLSPSDWLQGKPGCKVHFARALLGFKNAGCLDVHMLRHFPMFEENAIVPTVWQWEVWLEYLYTGNRAKVQRQHCEVLRWIRTGEMPLVPVQERLAI